MNFSTAFARYGAKLKNSNWAVSAIASDGSVVISCWSHYFKPKRADGALPYVDSLSRVRCAHPTRNGEAPLLAAYGRRYTLKV